MRHVPGSRRVPAQTRHRDETFSHGRRSRAAAGVEGAEPSVRVAYNDSRTRRGWLAWLMS